ncbi:efflux RND transporter periplasmic adaptor subunit [Pseudovibrio sp. SPO723]|uniref:efflux RND transporter periplasmic adaptor subunit n=1 Tax=Nesiotobacter zosterae TaxID=392721 RepID=UPI0029C1CF44|nr:efflux RND transporter periplasmic adaptor subunit [Pseudovibrio sp. SPO723]MDX5593151.1 efflux RND transporter periplasmic adaptor subunit [Pseudovibrio sp. SPO723]
MLNSLEDEAKQNRGADALQPRTANTPTHHRRSPLVKTGKAFLQGLIALVILMIAVMGMRYLIATKPEVATRPAAEREFAVRAMAVEIGDYAPLLTVYGEVVAGREVDLRALVGGEVDMVSPNLRSGGVVGAGEALLQIDPFSYEGARTEAMATLAEARARLVQLESQLRIEKNNIVRIEEQVAFADRDLVRVEELFQRGAATERSVDERKLILSQRQQNLEQTLNTLAVEEAKIEQQKAAIERAQWQLEQAERNVEDTTLLAPFEGVVRTEAVEMGRMINQNDVVAVLYDRNFLEVRFTLSDAQYGRLLADREPLAGRPVKVIWNIGDTPLEYDAVIERAGADIARSRGGVDVFARLSLEDKDLLIRPGAFVQVELPDRTYTGVARIPEEALYDGNKVYVIDADSRMERRDVQPLAFDDNAILVRGDLQSGERLVSSRIPEAGPGLKLRVVSEQAAGTN